MPYTLQEFLASSTIQAAVDLEEALLHLPEEKRNWKPTEQSRSALEQVAECALMNERVIDMIRLHDFPADFAYVVYEQEIVALCADWPTLQSLLHENAAKVAAVISAVSDDDAKAESDTMYYPTWNMTYHIAQINYIASLLN